MTEPTTHTTGSAGGRPRRPGAPLAPTLLGLLLGLLLAWAGLAGPAHATQVLAGEDCAMVKDGDRVIRAGDSCENEAGTQDGDSTRESAAAAATTPGAASVARTTTAGDGVRPGTPPVVEGTTPPGGTTSPPTAEDACPTRPPQDAIEATVESAVDGDTIKLAQKVDGKDTVRFIGMDTPELEGKNGQPEPFAEEAASFTARSLEGEKILLVPGKDPEDDYGRLLANVWTTQATGDGPIDVVRRLFGNEGEPELFGQTLLKKGLAEVLTIEPNDGHAPCFEQAQRQAKAEGVGIWGGEQQAAVAAEQYAGQTDPEATIPQGPTTEPTYPEPVQSGPTLPGTTAQQGTTLPEASAPDTVPEQTTRPESTDTIPDDIIPASQIPGIKECMSPDYLTAFSGDGEKTETLDVPTASFVVAYRIEAPAGNEKEGAFRIDVYERGSDKPVKELSHEELGTGGARVTRGPGEYELAAGAKDRRYDVTIYACGEEPVVPGTAPQRTAPEGATPEQTTPAQAPARATTAEEPADEQPAARKPVEGTQTEHPRQPAPATDKSDQAAPADKDGSDRPGSSPTRTDDSGAPPPAALRPGEHRPSQPQPGEHHQAVATHAAAESSPENATPEKQGSAQQDDQAASNTSSSGAEQRKSCPAKPREAAVAATVEEAEDGDTLRLDHEVDGTDEVRLIGVDAPEVAEPGATGEDAKAEPHAEEAKAYAANNLEGKQVMLVPGSDKKNAGGKLLVKVWIQPDGGLLDVLKSIFGGGGPELFNQNLVEQGLANVDTRGANDACEPCLNAARDEAADSGRGMWDHQDDDSGQTTATEQQYTTTGQPSATEQQYTTEPTVPSGGMEPTLPEGTYPSEMAPPAQMTVPDTTTSGAGAPPPAEETTALPEQTAGAGATKAGPSEKQEPAPPDGAPLPTASAAPAPPASPPRGR